MKSTLVLILLVALLAGESVTAEVTDAGPGGFTSVNEALIHSERKETWLAAINDINRWWDPAHTISGEGHRLSIDARPQGCFCEDLGDNTTRFLVVGRKILRPSGDDRTTLLISSSTDDRAGSLHALLEPLARHGVNLSRIESRPSRRRRWHYVFFLDLDGHAEDPAIEACIRELEERAENLRVLGSYPRAVL